MWLNAGRGRQGQNCTESGIGARGIDGNIVKSALFCLNAQLKGRGIPRCLHFIGAVHLQFLFSRCLEEPVHVEHQFFVRRDVLNWNGSKERGLGANEGNRGKEEKGAAPGPKKKGAGREQWLLPEHVTM